MFARWNARGYALLAVVAVAVPGGAAMGLGLYTFVYAEGMSYLEDDAATCANCHIMQDHYDAWAKSSHQAVAVCNDCHTPHAFVPKYMVKALNGYHHSLAFTTGNFHDPIIITSRNRRVTQAACRYCHADIVEEIDRFGEGEMALDCIRCHDTVGHME